MHNSNFNEIFSQRLRYYLSLNNMTQLELSKLLHVGTTSVSNWCKGIKTPRMDKVDAMCQIFNCRRRDLMEDPGDTDPSADEPSQLTLDPDQMQLLSYYDQLNSAGKEKARDYISDLAGNQKYTKDTVSSIKRMA